MGACYSTTAARDKQDTESNFDFDDEDEDDGHKWWSSSKRGSKFIFSGAGSGTEERLLVHVPGRLYSNGCCTTASLHTQQGKKGTNQDAMIVWEKFNSKGDAMFCGVFDGHGPYGHMVARKVRDSLPVFLSTQWMNTDNIDQNCENEKSSVEEELLEEYWCGQSDVEETNMIPDKYLPLKKSILKSFKLIDKELKNNPLIDCFCSGTTTVALIKQGQDLVIGNVGDSRAVLATRDENNSLTACQLTIDLKPNLPREAARIQEYNGRVFALQDEPEVSRVWLPHSDTPGLAMARAFGDFCLKDYGLISVPDVFYHRIIEKDEFVILATDGVWDVLSNKEAVDIVAAAPSRSTAARALVDCATKAWKLKFPTSKTDDCAVVCLFLDQKPMPVAPETLEKEVQKPNYDHNVTNQEDNIDQPTLEHSGTVRECSSEIVAGIDSVKEKLPEKSIGESKRSLAECISTSEHEWSALEGVTRANSLLSIPRFFSVDKLRSASWRKRAPKT
uniref:probable protein phosphatase 2C 66 n=1 Tax=Erigeron canadensis TaxID=72917 RepID=UPI001CB9B3C5|nr:probable protein phosphatase 2C 66 [Erigeron canadensis]